jgi:hypothetical protein
MLCIQLQLLQSARLTRGKTESLCDVRWWSLLIGYLNLRCADLTELAPPSLRTAFLGGTSWLSPQVRQVMFPYYTKLYPSYTQHMIIACWAQRRTPAVLLLSFLGTLIGPVRLGV